MRTRLERKWMIIMSGIAMAVVLFIGTPAVCMAYQSATGIVSTEHKQRCSRKRIKGQ